jgi:RNA-directed DNA polymerase
VNRKVHAGFASSRWGSSTVKKLAASASSDWNVILHHDLDRLQQARQATDEWLAKMGLRLKPSKTQVTHTLSPYQGQVGFDFLGFTIRQFSHPQYRTRTYRGQPGFKTLIRPSQKAVKRQLFKTKQIIRHYRGSAQAALIGQLNPIIRGWANYYKTCSAKAIFNDLDKELFWKLAKWGRFRHPRKWWKWVYRRYWKRHQTKGTLEFSDGDYTLINFAQTKIERHTKVKGHKSPFDGDWTYWTTRLGKDPTRPKRVCVLMKIQKGRCTQCGLRLRATDVLEVHHRDGNHHNHHYLNLALIHGHCHDFAHRSKVLLTTAA